MEYSVTTSAWEVQNIFIVLVFQDQAQNPFFVKFSLISLDGLCFTSLCPHYPQTDFCHIYIIFPLIWAPPGKRLSEKALATHSSTPAWKRPWMEKPGRLQSMGSLRVRHDWVCSLSLFTFMHWRRKWQPTPVFLPGESQGQRSLVGYSLWDRTESGTTDVT